MDAAGDLLERACALHALLDEQAARGEAQGQLTDVVVDALHHARLWSLWVPRTLGGSELDPVSSLEVIEALAHGDPSVAWVVTVVGLATGTCAAFLPDEAAEELFAGERSPVVCGTGTRPGSAVGHEGGFLLSGRWSFASGIKHATHVWTIATIEETQELRIFVLPREQVRLIDNWDVMGLRATGSIDYAIDAAFVPATHTHLADGEDPLRGGSLYRVGIPGIAAICHTGWALGLGRRLLDELAELARQGAGRPGAYAGDAGFLEGFERAEGKLRASRAFAFETWRDIWATLEGGGRLSVRQQTLLRLVITEVTWAVHEVGSYVYLAGGTTALRAGPIQRFFRDLHAGTQHMVVSPRVRRTIASELAGLSGDKVWYFTELVDPA